MHLNKNKKSFYPAVLAVLFILILTQSEFIKAAPSAKISDSDKIDKMLKLMESFDSRIKKLEDQTDKTIESKNIKSNVKSKSKKSPAVKSVSSKSYAPGWIVKVFKSEVQGNNQKLGNRVGAFIAKSLPITAKDHEKKSKVSGSTGYKISGYLKISHSAQTTIGMRLFSSKGVYSRYTGLCYRASLSLEGTDVINSKNVKAGTESAPNILTGVVNLEPGNYKIDIEYTCIEGQYKSPNHFDVTYLTDDMLNAKVISSSMMLRKVTK